MKVLFLILLVIAVGTSCKKKPTIWETDWSVPIINDTLTLKDFVNDSTLAENPGGFYELNLNRVLFELDVNEMIEIPDTTLENRLTISVLNLTMPPGFSYVTSNEENELSIPDVELKKIRLKKGFIDIKVHNPVGTIAIFDVSLPGVSKNGIIYIDQFKAPPGTNDDRGIVTATIDLSGYDISLTGLSSNSFNKLVSQISVSTDPEGPTVTTTNQDTTIVEATFRNLEIDYARGYFGNQIFTDTTELFLEELNIYESGIIDLPNTSIKFEFENSIKVGGEGALNDISNENNLGNTVALSHPQIGTTFNINPATGAWNTLSPTLKVIEFNSSNSNIEAYLENLGANHRIDYGFELNPWGNVSGGWDELFADNTIKVSLKANMPLQIGFDDLVLRDTFEVNLNQDPEKTKVLGGDLIIKANNAFPFSGAFDLIFLDEFDNVLHSVTASSLIEAAQFGSLDTDVNLFVADSEVKINLPDNVVADINSVKKIIVQVKLNSLNATTGVSEKMEIPVGAFLAIKLKTKFKTENIF